MNRESFVVATAKIVNVTLPARTALVKVNLAKTKLSDFGNAHGRVHARSCRLDERHLNEGQTAHRESRVDLPTNPRVEVEPVLLRI